MMVLDIFTHSISKRLHKMCQILPMVVSIRLWYTVIWWYSKVYWSGWCQLHTTPPRRILGSPDPINWASWREISRLSPRKTRRRPRWQLLLELDKCIQRSCKDVPPQPGYQDDTFYWIWLCVCSDLVKMWHHN